MNTARQHLSGFRIPKPLIIIALVIGLISLLFVFSPDPPLKPQTSLLPLVNTLNVEQDTYRPMVTLYGRVESPRESDLSATINAYVDSVNVEEGHRVKRGDILVTLEDSDVRLILEQRQAELDDVEAQIASEKARYENDLQALEVEKSLVELARKSVSRYEQLSRRNMASDVNRDEAQQQAQQQILSFYNREYAVQDHPHRLKRLQAQQMKLKSLRDQAALDLSRTRIVAPFDGRVTILNASPGNRVRPGDVVASLFDVGHVEVRSQIPSRYLSSVDQAFGQGTEIEANLVLDDETIPLTLERLAGSIEQGKGGVDALFAIGQTSRSLTLGRAGEILLHMPPVDNVVAVPPTAIYGQQRIYRVQDGVLHTVMIKRLGETLRESGERWQLIRGDIPAGSDILITQLPNAVGGLKVKVEHTHTGEPDSDKNSHLEINADNHATDDDRVESGSNQAAQPDTAENRS